MKRFYFFMLAMFAVIAASATTVYFENTANWSTVNAYAWSPNNAAWPGVKNEYVALLTEKIHQLAQVRSPQPVRFFSEYSRIGSRQHLAFIFYFPEIEKIQAHFHILAAAPCKHFFPEPVKARILHVEDCIYFPCIRQRNETNRYTAGEFTG